MTEFKSERMTDIDTDIDFRQIIPRLGSKTEAFEELCCQLARRSTDGRLHRLHGAGGDGGIECFLDNPEGRWGWQAKYVFRVDSLITQASKSLATALAVHPDLTRFVLCFPFDLTGPTARPGRSGIEKMNDWKNEREEAAQSLGRQLTIEVWPLSKLRSLLLDHDASGGLRYFFFGTTSLSDDWFAGRLKQALATADPRYTPELNVETDLHKWMVAFGQEEGWTKAVASELSPLREAERSLNRVLPQPAHESDHHPIWPDNTVETTRSQVARIQSVLSAIEHPATIATEHYQKTITELSEVASELRKVEGALVRDIDDRHGAGRAESVMWRQFMAEYMVSFPAAHLDAVRDLIGTIDNVTAWLRSPECTLALHRFFVLVGDPGTGKTHGVCDAAKRRHNEGLRTCIVFGHQFGSQPNPWSRVAESLGLPLSLGADRLLDCLNAAGEASGYPLLFCIDAINETKPLSYWKNYIATMVESVRARPHLRLLLVCKTTYLRQCLPDHSDFLVVTHRGFAGIERQACQTYFQHFGLRPPIAPILQPELSNPLYLRLVCDTLNKAGLDRLPPGWSGGGSAIIRDFLTQKASEFRDEFENSRPGVSTTCLMKIIRAIAMSEATSLPWSTARALTARDVPDADAVLNWFVNESLLIEDMPTRDGWEEDPVLRPAFERLGDFLIAAEVLNRLPEGDLHKAAQRDGSLHSWLMDSAAIQANQGVLGEFAVLASEQTLGFELPDLACSPRTHDDLALVAIRALVFRNPNSLTSSTAKLIHHALGTAALAYDAMDAILSCAWRQSSIDATWFHRFFRSAAMHERDAFWCGYLHERFESGGPVMSLIAAADELPLNDIEREVAERWVTVLLWFTAAADRRVKDQATRAATSILTSVPSIIPEVTASFIDVNDDEVRERVLLSCYGAMLMSRSAEIVQEVASELFQRYSDEPSDFDNAVIRDHIRCICELSIQLSPDASQDIDPEAIAKQPASSDWPLEIPSDEEVEGWAESLQFRPDEFHSDFFKYSMDCLRPWMHGLSKLDMGKWIAQRVARHFSFLDSKCEGYDGWMLQKYGGGRAKPVWAERIAKKYAWIALNQLGSRLQDHLERRLESWEEGRAKIPLILPQCRKLDPTTPASGGREAITQYDWIISKPKDLDTTATSNFEEWVKKRTMPTLKDIARTQSIGRHPMSPIVAFLNWFGAEKDSNSESSSLYRYMWVNLQSFLVTSDQLEGIYKSLRGQNLFGSWLPRSLHFLYGFAAEYPWSTVFDVSEESERQELPHTISGKPTFSAVPAWSEVVSEWEYDASRGNITTNVPSRWLCDRGLRWDGSGGFAASDGSTVFVDPSFGDSGPSALLADVDFLNDRLSSKGQAIILTLTGEKRVQTSGFGEQPNLPRCTVSQVGYLDGRTSRFGRPILSIE